MVAPTDAVPNQRGSGCGLVDDAVVLEAAARRKPLSAVGEAAAKRILASAGRPGGFGSGCSEARHELWRTCEHFLPRTFSPGPAEAQIRFKLPSGVRPGSDASARFLAHLLALRALIVAGFAKTAVVRENLQALRRMPRLYDDWGGGYTPILLVGALKVLKLDPHPESQDAHQRGLRVLMSNRRPMGWSDIPLAFVEELLEAPKAGRARGRESGARRKAKPVRSRRAARKKAARRRR